MGIQTLCENACTAKARDTECNLKPSLSLAAVFCWLDQMNPTNGFVDEEGETERNEFITSSYTRNTIKNLHLVPAEIIAFIAWYFRDHDQWDVTTTNEFIDIEENLISTTDTGWPYRTAFGSDEIRYPKVKKWYLSIPKGSGNELGVWSVIGIVESNKVSLNVEGNFFNEENNGYGLKGWDGCLYHGSNKIKDDDDEKMAKILYEGDEIVIVLDMKQGTLKYIINKVDCGIAFYIDKSKCYRLCVALSKNSKMILHK